MDAEYLWQSECFVFPALLYFGSSLYLLLYRRALCPAKLRREPEEARRADPRCRRGKPTQDYLTRVQRRITLPGAFFLGLVAVLPYLLGAVLPTKSSGLFLTSASGLLIVVGTIRDTVQLIETELRMHGYDDRLIS